MFYFLLQPLIEDYALLNIFRYITFRAILAALVSLLSVVLAGKYFIVFMQRKNNVLRKLTPQAHKKKAGTPSMGGVVILAGALLGVLCFADLANGFVLLSTFCLLGFAAIGFADDFMKMLRPKSKGMSFRMKMALQTTLASFIFIGYLQLDVRFEFFAQTLRTLNYSNLIIPFTKEMFIDVGVAYGILAVLVLVGSSNAVNLTDGLDGLATGLSLFVIFTFLVFSYASGHKEIAEYLKIPYIENIGELSVFIAAICGACLGFLWYNAHPAQIFMGDTGSLALGGIIGLLSLLLKAELLLVVVGGVFVVEAISVILQVGSYRFLGKRIFLMAPLHHHYEMLGLKESKIILRFWIVGIILVLVSLASLKIR